MLLALGFLMLSLWLLSVQQVSVDSLFTKALTEGLSSFAMP